MTLRIRTYLPFASTMLAGAVLLFAGVAQAKPPLTPNVPTTSDFGIAFDKRATNKLAFKHGVLLCDSAALTDCTVANMPLIAQGGPAGSKALRNALAKYVQKYVVTAGPNAGKVIWAEPQFDINRPLTPTEFADEVLGVGCYITSLTTVAITVLANTKATPTSRVATFNAISANEFYPASKDYNQLLWQYRLWADILQPNKADPTKPSPGTFLGLVELAGDLTPAPHAAIPELDSVSDSSLIDGLKHNKLSYLSYIRYRPKAVLTLGKGTYTVTLEEFGQHKVVVSGFQPGVFPLAIDDVGDGKMRRVHTARALSNLKWSFKDPSGSVKPVPVTAIKWDPKFVNQPMLVYEDQDQITLNDPNAQIIVIESAEEITMPPVGIVPLPCGPKSKPCVERQGIAKPPPVTKPPGPTPSPVFQPH